MDRCNGDINYYYRIEITRSSLHSNNIMYTSCACHSKVLITFFGHHYSVHWPNLALEDTNIDKFKV